MTKGGAPGVAFFVTICNGGIAMDRYGAREFELSFRLNNSAFEDDEDETEDED